MISGGMNAAQGGNFWHGFGAGFTSSLAGSGMSSLGVSNNDLPFLMGGVGALTAWGMGGDFMSGYNHGNRIGTWNHTAGDDPDPPPGWDIAPDGSGAKVYTVAGEVVVTATAKVTPKPSKSLKFIDKALEFTSNPMWGATSELIEHATGFRGLGRPFTVVSVANDTYRYSTGQISQTRYRYRLVGNNIAVGVGLFNKPVGFFIGTGFYLGEQTYDCLNFMHQEMYKFFQPENLTLRYFNP